MTIKFGELRIRPEALTNIQDCINRNWISAGPMVEKFEREWGQLFNYKYNRAVSSGTDACINACLALYDFGAKRGDEVIVPALSFIATSNAVRAAGFKPVFVDVKKETLNIDEDLIEEKITDKTQAIMVVHTMGRPCEMDKIVNMARRHNLILIGDACEAHGAKYKGRFVGNCGEDMSVFSFYIAHLICCGEGGMISTNSHLVDNIVKSTRSHGRLAGGLYFDHIRTGLNSKMNDLEASVGLSELPHFWEVFNKRHANMKAIMDNLKRYREAAWFSEEDDDCINCPHGVSITLKQPGIDRLKKKLDDAQIEWKRNFGCIPTQHFAFADMGHKPGEFPNAEYVGDNGIHIGCHAYLQEDDIKHINKTFDEFFQ